MERQTIIRSSNHKIIGRIRELPDRIEARTAGGVLLGWYDKSTDRTRCSGGELFSIGNVLSMLF